MATKLSQAYIDTTLQPQHIIPLDFDTIHELPESHAWTHQPTSESPNDQTSLEKHKCQIHVKEETTCVNVPIIDLKDPNVVSLIGNACQTWGMFQVTNHDVSWSLVNDVEAHARRLFALPAERKLEALRSPNGATGYGVARISPFFSKLMWHEGFTIMGSPAEHAKKLWPHDYEEFCDAMDNYQKKMKSLAYKILVLLLKALGLDENDQEIFCSASLHKSEGAFQLNSYPSCPNPNQAIGLAPHTDSLLLTILHQNDTIGLQIFQEGAGWKSVPPVSGALLVNVGDLMHIISNARFPSVYHRVVPNETRHRFTMAYFYGPPTDSIVAPLSKLSLPRFRPVTVKEYISIKSKHLEKAIDQLRIS